MQPFRKEISARTRYCAVYGQPIGHSASPAMQNAGMAALDLDWRYLAFETAPEHLAEAIAGAKAMRFIGLNLTVPHKLLAMQMVDELDASARKWGAINTIRFEGQTNDGQWKGLGQIGSEEIKAVRSRGFNTDADAIIQSIHEDLELPLKGASVILFGAGGAGRVAALKLAESGVSELWLVNRTISKAAEIAAEINRAYPGVRCAAGYPDKRKIDLALNATSLGLKIGDPLPFDPAHFQFTQATAVYDMVYRPAETPFLREAKAAGARVSNGLGMLLYQGAKALEIWSGLEAPVAQMREALHNQIYPK